MDLFLKKNHLIRCWDSLSLLDWFWALTLSLLQAWTFICTSWTLQYVSEGILFSRLLKVSLVVSVSKKFRGRFMAKNYCPVSLLSLVSKVIEKLVTNRPVNHLEKYDPFSDFQYEFRSSQSTAILWKLYLIELLGLLTGLWLLEL